jgi:hypothetical protein
MRRCRLADCDLRCLDRATFGRDEKVSGRMYPSEHKAGPSSGCPRVCAGRGVLKTSCMFRFSDLRRSLVFSESKCDFIKLPVDDHVLSVPAYIS